jgi:hypothetical protein
MRIEKERMSDGADDVIIALTTSRTTADVMASCRTLVTAARQISSARAWRPEAASFAAAMKEAFREEPALLAGATASSVAQCAPNAHKISARTALVTSPVSMMSISEETAAAAPRGDMQTPALSSISTVSISIFSSDSRIRPQVWTSIARRRERTRERKEADDRTGWRTHKSRASVCETEVERRLCMDSDVDSVVHITVCNKAAIYAHGGAPLRSAADSVDGEGALL